MRCESKENQYGIIQNQHRVHRARIAKETGLSIQAAHQQLTKEYIKENQPMDQTCAFIIIRIYRNSARDYLRVGVHCDDVLKKTKYAGTGHLFAITTWAFGVTVTLFIFGGGIVTLLWRLLK